MVSLSTITAPIYFDCFGSLSGSNSSALLQSYIYSCLHSAISRTWHTKSAKSICYLSTTWWVVHPSRWLFRSYGVDFVAVWDSTLKVATKTVFIISRDSLSCYVILRPLIAEFRIHVFELYLGSSAHRLSKVDDLTHIGRRRISDRKNQVSAFVAFSFLWIWILFAGLFEACFSTYSRLKEMVCIGEGLSMLGEMGLVKPDFILNYISSLNLRIQSFWKRLSWWYWNGDFFI